MPRILHHGRTALLAAAWLLVSATPALAEDIEIYLGLAAASSTACGTDPAYVNCSNPNVLFMLDDSGSMNDPSGVVGVTRMTALKTALTGVLSSVNNINAGLGTYTIPGGPINFPVADINAPLSDVEGAATTVTLYSGRIASSTDDAEEQLYNHSVQLASNTLKLATDPSLGSDITVTSRPTANADDMVEYRTNNTNQTVDGSWLHMGNLRMDHLTREINASGVRFPNLAIPQGKTITSAILTLTSNADVQTETTGNTKIRGELADNAAQYVAATPAAGVAGNITARARTNAAATVTVSNITPWSSDDNVITFEDPAPGTVTSQRLAATGLKAIVQEVVNRPGWASGNALALMFGGIDRSSPAAPTNSLTGTGRFGAYSVNSSPSATQDPLLTVTYSPGITNLAQDIGLRFTDVSIPQGATITSAYIELVPVANATDTPSWTILGEAVDNAATFTAAASNIHNRVTGSPTSATVAWAPGNWTAETTVQTPSLVNVVQEIVNRAGWCGNSAMSFLITGTTGARSVYSYEGDANKAPRLVVDYDYDPANPPAGSNGCISQIFQYQVATSSDDAEETISTASLNLTSSDLDFVTTQINGMRFTGVLINPGATILEAYLDLTSNAAFTGSADFTIKGDLTLPSKTFASSPAIQKVNARTKTSASVAWPISTDWASNGVYRSPDIRSVVQEIVNNAGWSANSALTLLVTTGSSSRAAYSYDGSSANAPRLIVKLRSDGVHVKTVRERLIELTNAIVPAGNTPLVGYYTEAARYFKGSAVKWGLNRGGTIAPANGASLASNSVSHFASYTGGTVTPAGCSGSTAAGCATEQITGSPIYRSPIVDECQNNYIVLLTDGEATYSHVDDVTLVQGWTGSNCAGSGHEKCGRELANYLHTQDQNSTLNSAQHVTTYTIGFGADVVSGAAAAYLRDVATLGGGAFYSADSASGLTSVFTNIISSILSVNSGFEAPALSVNSYNRLTNRDELYYALFKPSTQQRWDGNVKKYRLGEDGVTHKAVIVDAHNVAAVDPATGFFVSTAQSYWSPTADGSDVATGGAASVLPAAPTGRNAYTYTGSLPTVPVSLTLPQYKLVETNTANVTTTLLGIGGTNGDAAHQELLKWAHGVDPATNTATHQYGDPLHAKPVVVTFFDDGDPAHSDQALLSSNNQGYFSILNPTTGVELFTWVPKELLSNLKDYFNNSGTVTGNGGKKYGLDGEITLNVKDANGNGDLRDAGDTVYATLGMRRGGRNYYTLDLGRTAQNTYGPKLQWEILGGDNTNAWGELGQTWSGPKLGKVKLNNVDREVLFFAGGYDPNQDNVLVRTADDMGRAIYMVDASTGALLWMAGKTSVVHGTKVPDLNINEMIYSIPADVAILDTNGDGYVDRLYVGDMGGQIFRFDFKNATNTGAGNFAVGGRIAELADNLATGNRRFYNAPDVALDTSGDTPYLGLAIGSGYREHPLTNVTIVDRFYVLRDKHILDTVETASINTEYSITESDLTDLTSDPLETATPDPAVVAAFNNSDGWYVTLEHAGEKVLGKALTFNGLILFDTFDPASIVVPNVCSTGLGQGRLYIVNAYDASSVLDLDPLGTGKLDRVKPLDRGGIPPEPVIVFRDTGNPDDRVDPTLLVGTEVIDTSDPGTGENILKAGVALRKAWWRQDK